MSIRSSWSIVSFKVCVSLLIFCLVDLSIVVSGVLKSPTIIVLLLFAPELFSLFLAGSNSKFRLVHASFINQTVIKPLLCASTVPGTLHTVFQVLTRLKGTIIIPISQVLN